MESLRDCFEEFCNKLAIQEEKLYEMRKSKREISKKLNREYYKDDVDDLDKIYIVGSVGRGTAIDSVSDLDIIYDLPEEVFRRFDSYKNNKQSSLLQEVKNKLKERYPKTKISGNGQVVVIEFNKYLVELVPGFKQSDGLFKYPDTNDGGSWKKTNPISEQEEIKQSAIKTNYNYIKICQMLREWKNTQNFKFGGLLIDTLVYNFLHSDMGDKYNNILVCYEDFFELIKDLFGYLKNLNKDQKYWYAPGSNQKVYSTDNCKFVNKAEYAYRKIIKIEDSEDKYRAEVLNEIFGNKFPKIETTYTFTDTFTESSFEFRDTEQFIEDSYPIDIKYDLSIDCKVTQKGFRVQSLKDILKENKILRRNKELEFYIDYIDRKLKEPYNIYWKVKNRGIEAERLDNVRGEIIKSDSNIQRERTSFRGEHYVECYIIKDNICVARANIIVPISNL